MSLQGTAICIAHRRQQWSVGACIGAAVGMTLLSWLTPRALSGDNGQNIEPLVQRVAGFPAKLEGPIDAALPVFGRVWCVYVEPGEDERIGIAWVRSINYDRLRWDATAGVWRAKGSTKTFPAPPTDPDRPPDAFSDRPCFPSESDVYADGEYVGMAIVGPAGLECVGFIENVGPNSSLGGSHLRCPSYCNGVWSVPLTLWPLSASVIHPNTHGLAVARFDATGWGRPSIILPMVSGLSVWLFEQPAATDVFWSEYYHDRLDPPDFMGGPTRLRLNHTRKQGAGFGNPRSVYERTFRRGEHNGRHQVVQLGPGRFDLLYVRSIGSDRSNRIRHVRDLLGRNRKAETQIGKCHCDSSLAVVRLSDNDLSVLWLDEESPAAGPSKPPRIRLVETRCRGDHWSAAQSLFQSMTWDYSSLAAAPFRRDGKEWICAVWRERGGTLTYSIASPDGIWTKPAVTNLKIGSPNWLVAWGDRCVLITTVDGNLYWCAFALNTLPPRGSDEP